MEFFNDIIERVDYFVLWLNDGIYGFFEELLKELVAWLVIAKLEFMLWTLKFSWGVASQIMFNLGIGAYLQAAFTGLDPQLMGYINFFRLPEAINLITQAVITRVTLRVMGW